MFTLKDMPATASSMFSAYANFAAFSMMIRSMATELIPDPIRSYIYSLLHSLFASSHHHHHLTLVVDEHSGNMARNQVFDSAEVYLRAHISPAADRLHVSKAPRQKSISLSIDKGQEISDTFGNINLKWSYVCTENKNGNYTETRRYFELTFLKKHKAQVVDSYLPYVIDRANAIKEEAKVVKLYTTNSVYNNSYDDDSHGNWNSINLEHPSTFETIAMDPDQKKMIMEDLDRFLRRREFYKKVGKAWKRGYLLYGPPGTGKSSLIAAMANYLKFDVYDLELASIYNDSALRSTLLSTTNRSILVIEDIDCSVEMKNREGIHESQPSNKLTLSGLLNFIDGLWSSCGDERIIVFTTNHKDRLDPALLRPGRMDMHIHMSYCTPNGFMILASNYLGIHDSNPHNLCGEIEGLIESTEVTPAEVAEELMKSDDVDVALQGLASFLKRRKVESSNKIKDEEVINQTDEIQEVDRETENGEQC